jgi:UDP-3-O-[3-hydroxymyristoyl] glucosamine N-acyltransferase
MFRLKSREIYASEIAEFIGSELIGNDFIVRCPVSNKHLESNSFTYVTEEIKIEEKCPARPVLFITPVSLATDKNYSYILSVASKLDFIRVVNEFFIEIESFQISNSARIHPEARLARNVSVGENCVIGPDVSIGENTLILNNVVISSRVDIGNNCIIKDNSTIGSEGYDFETDESGIPVHYPHFGKIIIGNNVWIGSNTTIESAAIEDTIIHDYVKIDDLVQIGAGGIIKRGCMITAGVILSRNVMIMENSWLAPNATVLENLTIGKNCIVGAGSVVIKNVDNELVVAGNPAVVIRKNK